MYSVGHKAKDNLLSIKLLKFEKPSFAEMLATISMLFINCHENYHLRVISCDLRLSQHFCINILAKNLTHAGAGAGGVGEAG
jgi:hypothetical protein